MTNVSVTTTNKTHVQNEEIKMSINLRCVDGISEKPRLMLKSHKTRSTFYTENFLYYLLCKLKDLVATEDKNSIIDKNNCSSSEVVYFGESKLESKHKSRR